MNFPEFVTVSGKYAYVADYSDDALKIIDVSNPATPVQVGSVSDSLLLNGVDGVVVFGKYAYVSADGGSFAIVDVSNPKHRLLLQVCEGLTHHSLWLSWGGMRMSAMEGRLLLLI